MADVEGLPLPPQEQEVLSQQDYKVRRGYEKGKLTRKGNGLDALLSQPGEPRSVFDVKAQLVDIYEECKRLHNLYITADHLSEEEDRAAQTWIADLDRQFESYEQKINQYLAAHPMQPQDNSTQYRSARALQLMILQNQQDEEQELEDLRIAQERQAEDIRIRNKRDRQAMANELTLARTYEAGASPSRILSSTPLHSPAPKRAHTSAAGPDAQPVTAPIDSWIDEAFEPDKAARGDGNGGLMAMALIPNLQMKKFNGNSREWPMWIQSFKSMVHDMIPSDALRLTILHSMLSEELQVGVGGTHALPGCYQSALKHLKRIYGRPDLVVRDFISNLMDIPSIGETDVKALSSFQSQLNGAVTTLQNFGYGHELKSSIAVRELVKKLPKPLITRWGRHITRMSPKVPTLTCLNDWLEEAVVSAKMVQETMASVDPPEQQPPRPSSSSGRRYGNQRGAEYRGGFGNRGTFNLQGSLGYNSASGFRSNLDQGLAHQYRPASASMPNIAHVIDAGQDESCSLCGANPGHGLTACSRFMALSPTERAKVVWTKKNCFRCLGRLHTSQSCRKTHITCTVGTCRGPHHSLLHGSELITPKGGGAAGSQSNA